MLMQDSEEMGLYRSPSMEHFPPGSHCDMPGFKAAFRFCFIIQPLLLSDHLVF